MLASKRRGLSLVAMMVRVVSRSKTVTGLISPPEERRVALVVDPVETIGGLSDAPRPAEGMTAPTWRRP